MDLLNELRATKAPRSDALARSVALQLDRRLALLGLGLLYYLLVSNEVLLAVGYGLFALGRHLFAAALPTWYLALSAFALVGLLWLSLWPFRWWKNRRVDAALELGRTGEVIEGEIAQWRQRGNATFAVIWFAHAGHEHAILDDARREMGPTQFPVGTRVPLLYAPRITRALYFAPDGRSLPVIVQDGPRARAA